MGFFFTKLMYSDFFYPPVTDSASSPDFPSVVAPAFRYCPPASSSVGVDSREKLIPQKQEPLSKSKVTKLVFKMCDINSNLFHFRGIFPRNDHQRVNHR